MTDRGFRIVVAAILAGFVVFGVWQWASNGLEQREHKAKLEKMDRERDEAAQRAAEADSKALRDFKRELGR